jgi:SAM-dependent methyltransferase
MSELRINVGCGSSPTNDWINYDSSFSIKISKLPLYVPKILLFLGLIKESHLSYITFLKTSIIRYGNILKGLPNDDGSVSVIYTSHMLEHFDHHEADIFCKEVQRLLIPGGVIRIVVPDIAIKINDYSKHKNADLFIESLNICIPRPKTIFQKFYSKFIENSYGYHQRMYDSKLLMDLLKKNNFIDIKLLPAGETTINDSGDLDLREAEHESLYMEAKKGF